MTSRYHHTARAHSVSSTSTATTVAAHNTTFHSPPEAVVPRAPAPIQHSAKSKMGPTSVRRNLFHHHLSRRPASTASTPPIEEGHEVTGRPHVTRTASTVELAGSSSLGAGPVDNGDIVVKDKNGGYRLDIPVLSPTMTGEDGDEVPMEGVEEGRPSGGSGGTGVSSVGDADISGREKEKIEASLVEMMYRNRSRQISGEPAEILNLIHQSLRNKVAALDDDNWMYEPEDERQI
ncbi:hypothetical protein DTO212C5_1689 [Paecilomyces variotii]|nr:hypothetical protein DTO212C5_1689 [Paecilomyces variotii]